MGTYCWFLATNYLGAVVTYPIVTAVSKSCPDKCTFLNSLDFLLRTVGAHFTVEHFSSLSVIALHQSSCRVNQKMVFLQFLLLSKISNLKEFLYVLNILVFGALNVNCFKENCNSLTEGAINLKESSLIWFFFNFGSTMYANTFCLGFSCHIACPLSVWSCFH